MTKNIILYIKNLLPNIPNDWLTLTTHRLDIYNENLAKTDFLNQFETLYNNSDFKTSTLNKLPTAYDYIRLGHPLSCILEWTIAKLNDQKAENIISFSSKTMPLLAILRKNSISKKKSRIVYVNNLPSFLNIDVLQNVYSYDFTVLKVSDINEISDFIGSTIFISQNDDISSFNENENIDFHMNYNHELGSVIFAKDESYISEIQHVRRRESIAMPPNDCLIALKQITNQPYTTEHKTKVDFSTNKSLVTKYINKISGTNTKVVLGSCGLSIQYAILMGLIDNALEHHKDKAIKIVLPTNCYGGTNDQARRIANCINNVSIVDLSVDGNNDMINSINIVLEKIASEDAIPFIIAEIPTNPRVEVPNLIQLKNTLSISRKTKTGKTAISPIFILDQTFCPNVNFLGENGILSSVKTISYVSGSKFPSGGKCTAGYCLGNNNTISLMQKIEFHLDLCDNGITPFQTEILAKQLPSMNQRIEDAYNNTRELVCFIEEILPEAKINFVSNGVVKQGFTPSVFSIDLPSKGTTSEEKETYKRNLNNTLIQLMITEIPDESKYCVSYGQLNGCYWTIPATSTQGTTKEGHKDYIVRVSLSPNMNIELHKKVFSTFVENIKNN